MHELQGYTGICQSCIGCRRPPLQHAFERSCKAGAAVLAPGRLVSRVYNLEHDPVIGQPETRGPEMQVGRMKAEIGHVHDSSFFFRNQ